MLEREAKLQQIRSSLRRAPVVALLGPRQSGKTTLARQYLRSIGVDPTTSPAYFDLEDPLATSRLQNPMLALRDLRGTIVLDEIQRVPEIFPVLRVLADRPDVDARFLVLGSASPALLRQSSESLAGRIEFIDVMPFDLSEVGPTDARRLWHRGGFPPAFLARSDDDSSRWRRAFIQTFLERDLATMGIGISAETLRRFWMMLAHTHGQMFNAAEIATSLQIAQTSARRYLDTLAGTFMVRILPPWHENIAKRQVKRPKVYLRDSGLLHSLLGLDDEASLLTHPKLGASWEGFALEQFLLINGVENRDAYFWAVHQQAELDLLIHRGGKRYGVEIKYVDAPRVTSSMRQAIDLLKLEKLFVLIPNGVRAPVADRIELLPLSASLPPVL